jgi:hypothetical protein
MKKDKGKKKERKKRKKKTVVGCPFFFSFLPHFYFDVIFYSYKEASITLRGFIW